MTVRDRVSAIRGAAIVAFVAAGLSAPGVAQAHEAEKHEKAKPADQATPAAQAAPDEKSETGPRQTSEATMPRMRLRMPVMDAVRGRTLFVSKGCVACHSINGVGGHDAVNLDAHTMEPVMNPFEFAAKMWRMGPVMIQAQEEALGEQILFTGDELADIIAFVHNDEEQHKFTQADVTPEARRMMHHEHVEPGGGPKAHAKELGHDHMMEGDHGAQTSPGHGD